MSAIYGGNSTSYTKYKNNIISTLKEINKLPKIRTKPLPSLKNGCVNSTPLLKLFWKISHSFWKALASLLEDNPKIPFFKIAYYKDVLHTPQNPFTHFC